MARPEHGLEEVSLQHVELPRHLLVLPLSICCQVLPIEHLLTILLGIFLWLDLSMALSRSVSSMLSFLATSSYFLSASAAKYFASYIQETQNKFILLLMTEMQIHC